MWKWSEIEHHVAQIAKASMRHFLVDVDPRAFAVCVMGRRMSGRIAPYHYTQIVRIKADKINETRNLI